MPKKLFNSENQPANRAPRGKSFKTMVIDALKTQGMSEQEFIERLVDRALADGGVFMTELLKRYSPIPKQTHEPITIEFPADGTPVQKADAVLKAMAEGLMSPDIGAIFIEAISKSLGIAEVTELARRLEAVEKFLEEKQ
jgi:hypothetical protein